MAKASRREPLNHSAARTTAALLGTLPVALGFGMLLARTLPLSPGLRYLIGNFCVFPVWVALSSWVFLAPSGRRAWLGLLAASALLGGAWFGSGVPRMLPSDPPAARLTEPR